MEQQHGLSSSRSHYVSGRYVIGLLRTVAQELIEALCLLVSRRIALPTACSSSDAYSEGTCFCLPRHGDYRRQSLALDASDSRTCGCRRCASKANHRVSAQQGARTYTDGPRFGAEGFWKFLRFHIHQNSYRLSIPSILIARLCSAHRLLCRYVGIDRAFRHAFVLGNKVCKGFVKTLCFHRVGIWSVVA